MRDFNAGSDPGDLTGAMIALAGGAVLGATGHKVFHGAPDYYFKTP